MEAGEALAELELAQIAREEVLGDLHERMITAPEGSYSTRALVVELLLNDIMER